MTQHPPMPPGYYGAGTPAQPRGGLAVSSLVLGIIGLVFGWIPVANWFIGTPCIVLALVFGGLAFSWGKAKAGVTCALAGLAGVILWTAVFSSVVSDANKYDDCARTATTAAELSHCDRYVH